MHSPDTPTLGHIPPKLYCFCDVSIHSIPEQELTAGRNLNCEWGNEEMLRQHIQVIRLDVLFYRDVPTLPKIEEKLV